MHTGARVRVSEPVMGSGGSVGNLKGDGHADVLEAVGELLAHSLLPEFC